MLSSATRAARLGSRVLDRDLEHRYRGTSFASAAAVARDDNDVGGGAGTDEEHIIVSAIRAPSTAFLQQRGGISANITGATVHMAGGVGGGASVLQPSPRAKRADSRSRAF